MDFKERLKKAADRGANIRDEQDRQEAAKTLNEEECKRLHSKYRLELTEYIENCLKQLADQFPGFHFEPVINERGWGAAASRDDMGVVEGRRDNFYSRIELLVASFNKYHVFDLSAKGAIRNRESFTRNHYQLLSEVDMDSFTELVDLWVLDYAEQYAAQA